MRGSWLLLLVGGATACGLTVTGSSADDDGRAASGDAGRDTAADASSAAPADGAALDGGVDAPIDGAPAAEAGGGCTVLVDDSFTTQSASWDVLESASFGPGRVELTPRNDGAHAGAIWWKTPLTFSGVLRVEVELTVDTNGGSSPGHGIAVAWVSTATPYVIGPMGQSFGLCNAGLTGVAVAADTRDDDLLVMDGIAGDCSTNNGVWPAAIGEGGKLTMELRTTSLVATYGAVSGTRAVTAPTTGYLGITAATGGSGESEHVIESVRVESCP